MANVQDRARDVMSRAISAFNATEPVQIPDTPDTVLLGEGGIVDSLGLVRLVLTVERQIEQDTGTALSLTDERAMSQRTSPFRSVGALTAYIATCLTERP